MTHSHRIRLHSIKLYLMTHRYLATVLAVIAAGLSSLTAGAAEKYLGHATDILETGA